MSWVGGSLQERSEIYHARPDVYELLSRAEDAPGEALRFLAPRVQGLDLLDVGCGTGKYCRLLAPPARSVVGVDAAAPQLEIARRSLAELPSVRLVHGDALDAPLPGAPYGAAIACWMLGTVLDDARRLAIAERVSGLLSPGGMFYLVENDACGEFESMRGRVQASLDYGSWLQEAGFERLARFGSFFEFQSIQEAAAVLGAIWGPAVGAKASGSRVEHRIAIWGRRANGPSPAGS